jgi:serine protease
MRYPLLSLAIWCAILLLSPATPTRAQAAAADTSARVIVKYKADSPLLHKDLPSAAAQQADRTAALGKRLSLALRAGAGVAERTQVVFASGMTSEQLAQRLAAESDIEYAVPDRRRRHTAAPNDPLYLAGPAISGGAGGPVVGQWYLRAPSGNVQSSINFEPAWDGSVGGTNIVVAVIDTGVRFDHPDLQRVAAGGNLLPGYDLISDVATANDGDGRDPDASDPGDWVTLAEVQQRGGSFDGCDTVAEDSSWHGTQTGGLIGALANNAIGMAGVGRNVRVLPVRALGKCGGFDSDIIAGMLWAAGLIVPGVPANPNPARVLNLSLSGEGACTSAYLDAVARVNAVGAVVVAAAGNSTGHAVGTPANCAGVIAVAGLRHVGSKVGFSALGPEISISAPAGNCVNIGAGEPCLYPILTTANSGLTVPVSDAAGG